MRYPVTLTKDDNDTILVSFPDFPEAHTFGEDREEALVRAVDALATIIDAYIKDRRPIPAPSTGRTVVELPTLMSTKVCLYQEMQAGKIGKAELGRRLNWHLPQVDRLLDVRHSSQLDQLESAFKVMGKKLEVTVVDDAAAIRQALARWGQPGPKRVKTLVPHRGGAATHVTVAPGHLAKRASKKR